MIILYCLILLCGYALWRVSRSRCSLAHLPSFPQLPLIGHAHYMLGGGRKMFLRLLKITKVTEESQLPFVFWMGPCLCLILHDMDDIKAVTNKFIEKPYFYQFARPWLGDGLLTASGTTWKRNVKHLAGTYTTGMVDGFQDIFNSQAKKFVRSLETEVGQPAFDVMEKYLAKTTLELICQIALGVPKISDTIATTEYYKAFAKTLEIIQIRGFNIVLHSELLFGLTSYKKELLNSIDKLHHVTETVLKLREQREDIKENNTWANNNKTENTKCNFKSYLDILMELKAKDPTFTVKQMRNEIDTIILAGQETVATSLFYILLMIGCHSRVQDKLYAEFKEIFGDSKRDVTKDDLNRMTYCEAVIYETLRLYPPAPGVLRVADDELQLKSCTVPKGTNCFINIFGHGRSKKNWGADAEEFRPERFETDYVPSMVLAFSSGKRACIGKKYAIPIMKTIIAYSMRDLVFTAEADKIKLELNVALRTENGNLLQVQHRQK